MGGVGHEGQAGHACEPPARGRVRSLQNHSAEFCRMEPTFARYGSRAYASDGRRLFRDSWRTSVGSIPTLSALLSHCVGKLVCSST